MKILVIEDNLDHYDLISGMCREAFLDSTLTHIRAQLFLLFQNLISNGVKFNDGDPEIRVQGSFAEGDQYFSVSVSGNGIGMKPESLNKYLTRFIDCIVPINIRVPDWV
jgi:signal transduction histidine kinase